MTQITSNEFLVCDNGVYTVYTDFLTLCHNTFVFPLHSSNMYVISLARGWSYNEIVRLCKSYGWIDDNNRWIVGFPLPISDNLNRSIGDYMF